MLVLLAAKAASPSTTFGICWQETFFHVLPPSFVNSIDKQFPSVGSPIAMPLISSKNYIET
jgi:hypothetical protein